MRRRKSLQKLVEERKHFNLREGESSPILKPKIINLGACKNMVYVANSKELDLFGEEFILTYYKVGESKWFVLAELAELTGQSSSALNFYINNNCNELDKYITSKGGEQKNKEGGLKYFDVQHIRYKSFTLVKDVAVRAIINNYLPKYFAKALTEVILGDEEDIKADMCGKCDKTGIEIPQYIIDLLMAKNDADTYKKLYADAQDKLESMEIDKKKLVASVRSILGE